ncbi:hypothetical protein BDR07DRAFT_1391610 [Suillus spraguei]|nr:hypothetical protein BDR07DRAFT_1391610 [Suillus spraguei]
MLSGPNVHPGPSIQARPHRRTSKVQLSRHEDQSGAVLLMRSGVAYHKRRGGVYTLDDPPNHVILFWSLNPKPSRVRGFDCGMIPTNVCRRQRKKEQIST